MNPLIFILVVLSVFILIKYLYLKAQFYRLSKAYNEMNEELKVTCGIAKINFTTHRNIMGSQQYRISELENRLRDRE